MSNGSPPAPPGPPRQHSQRGPLLLAAVLVLFVAGLLGAAAYLVVGYLSSQADRQGSGPAAPEDRRTQEDSTTPPPGDGGPGLVRFEVVLEDRAATAEDCPSGSGWTTFEGECLRLGDGMVAEVRATVAEQQGRPVVELVVEPPADRELATFTQKHEGRRIALVAEGQVLAAPQIVSAITDGRIWVTGVFDRPRAEELAQLINGSS